MIRHPRISTLFPPPPLSRFPGRLKGAPAADAGAQRQAKLLQAELELTAGKPGAALQALPPLYLPAAAPAQANPAESTPAKTTESGPSLATVNVVESRAVRRPEQIGRASCRERV